VTDSDVKKNQCWIHYKFDKLEAIHLVAQRLKELRLQHNYTIPQLTDYLSMYTNYTGIGYGYKLYEDATNKIKVETLLKLAKLYKIDINEFYTKLDPRLPILSKIIKNDIDWTKFRYVRIHPDEIFLEDEDMSCLHNYIARRLKFLMYRSGTTVSELARAFDHERPSIHRLLKQYEHDGHQNYYYADELWWFSKYFKRPPSFFTYDIPMELI
jgi:transcriptional regulator with XRE-family HTH domain